MDESQIEKLGSKMRDVYAEVETAPAPVEAAPKHPSRRLRKNRYVTRTAARSMPRQAAAAGNYVSQRPFTTLLIAAGAGYLLARLSR